jgi:hypothetical protein
MQSLCQYGVEVLMVGLWDSIGKCPTICHDLRDVKTILHILCCPQKNTRFGANIYILCLVVLGHKLLYEHSQKLVTPILYHFDAQPLIKSLKSYPITPPLASQINPSLNLKHYRKLGEVRTMCTFCSHGGEAKEEYG